jgi:hypothetical protein
MFTLNRRRLSSRVHQVVLPITACLTALMLGAIGAKSASAQAVSTHGRIIIFRIDTYDGDSILTSDLNELTRILTSDGGTIVTRIGSAYSSPYGVFSQPIYRLHNTTTGRHYATTSASEEASLVASGAWAYDYTIGYAKAPNTGNTGDVVNIWSYLRSNGDHYFSPVSFFLQSGTNISGSGTGTINDTYFHGPIDDPTPSALSTWIYDCNLQGGTYTREIIRFSLGGFNPAWF